MRATLSTNSRVDPYRAVSSKTNAWREVIGGYAVATLGLVLLLTVNGVSGVPSAVSIGTTILIAIGLLLPAVGMLQLRRAVGHDRRAARNAFALQATGLIGLLFGVLPLAASSSLSALFVVSAILIVSSAALAGWGAILLRGHQADIGATNKRAVDYLILATTLIFAGVGVILASNVGSSYFLSDVGNTVFTDAGATMSAWGCVIAAYSFFVLHPARRLYPDGPARAGPADRRWI